MRRPRPVAGVDIRVITAPLGGSSFPSGHTITYVGIYGFLAYLARSGYAVPPALLARDVTTPIAASPALQAVLIDIYRRDPKNAELCERLVDLDEGFQEWRYRHVKMVERTIGTRMGTGGSAGAAYLQGTVGRPAFPDLWAIRSSL